MVSIAWPPVSLGLMAPPSESVYVGPPRPFTSSGDGLDDQDLVPVGRRAVAILDRVLVDVVVEDVDVPAAAPFLVVEKAAQLWERVPSSRQRGADGRRFDDEVPTPACVGGEECRQPDLDPGYDATFTQSTRAKLAGSRDQLSPSSALA
jgi:hypothetical protein